MGQNIGAEGVQDNRGDGAGASIESVAPGKDIAAEEQGNENHHEARERQEPVVPVFRAGKKRLPPADIGGHTEEPLLFVAGIVLPERVIG